VASYARHYRYSPAEQAEVSERLQTVTRLLKQHDCADSGQLLDAAAKAEASLETWFHAEGAAPFLLLIGQAVCSRLSLSQHYPATVQKFSGYSAEVMVRSDHVIASNLPPNEMLMAMARDTQGSEAGSRQRQRSCAVRLRPQRWHSASGGVRRRGTCKWRWSPA
jgi:hypothetical protein